jgi:hypothetical protein
VSHGENGQSFGLPGGNPGWRNLDPSIKSIE